MADVITTIQTEVVESVKQVTEIVDRTQPHLILEVAKQGPPGPPGPIGDAQGAFLVSNRFFEIAEDELAKTQARENLGVQYVDGGTFN